MSLRKTCRLTPFLLAAAAFLAAGSVVAWADHLERVGDFEWRGRVAAGKTLEVKGLNGGIEARPASGGEIVVNAVKRAHRGDEADEVRIEVVEHAEGVTVCAVYPGVRSSDPQNPCGPNESEMRPRREYRVVVDFEVEVPSGVRFVGRTVNGGIGASGLSADAEAYSVNGGIQISTAGHARAETVNGAIRAALGRADWKGPLALKTVNGSVAVELPADAGAEVEARTVNGHIESDFPLTVEGRFNSRRLAGTLGAGGRKLRLETVNGSIQLLKAQ